MKTNIPILILALILSTISLIHSYKTSRSMNQEQVQKAVDDALKEREKKFINEVKPRFKVMFAEMGGELDKGWNPETIEELIQPLINIIDDVSTE